MLHLTSGPALVVEIGLAIFCFVDVLIAREEAVRWTARWVWVLAILIFPLGGSICWVVAGRSWRLRVRTVGAGSGMDDPRSPLGMDGIEGVPATNSFVAGGTGGRHRSAPEDGTHLVSWPVDYAPDGPISPWPPADAGLAAELWELNEEHERTLRLWEADLRRREQQLRAASEVDAA